MLVPGIRAMLAALLLYGPLMPGPLRKKPKTSLIEFTNSRYSSLANTKRKERESPVGTKSNWSTAASYDWANPDPEAIQRSLSPGPFNPPAGVVVPPWLLGPNAPVTSPEDITMPESRPSMQLVPLKVPS